MSDPRPWTYAALFGSLWGALELSLGTILSLARVPLYGMLMAFLGLLCLVSLRRLQPRAGVCLVAGLVAVLLKVFSMGGLYPGPLVAIAGQSLLAELVFVLAGCRRLTALAAGALVIGAAPLQKVITVWIVAGTDTLRAVTSAAAAAIVKLGGPQLGGGTMLAVILGLSGLVGAVGGQTAWTISGRVLRRLGRHRC